MARTKKLPPKSDENGKKVDYTTKELEALKEPARAPGYMAARGDVVAGSIVEAVLVREKSIPAAKLAESDLKLKYVTILSHDPNPPKDIGTKTDEKKKKN